MTNREIAEAILADVVSTDLTSGPGVRIAGESIERGLTRARLETMIEVLEWRCDADEVAARIERNELDRLKAELAKERR